MNRSCGQEEYQVHLQALRAQLLHLNPSHWGGRSVSESSRLRQSCSWALSASRRASRSLHCLPPVSTYHFFSNSPFFQNYSRLDLKRPARENLAALLFSEIP